MRSTVEKRTIIPPHIFVIKKEIAFLLAYAVAEECNSTTNFGNISGKF
jgi:hypothetical protein